MGQSHAIPMIGPDVQDLPPHALRRVLREGEQLVWWSRGDGSTFDASSVIVTTIAAIGEIAILFVWPDPALALALPLLWAIMVLPRILVGARYEIYGLTDRRVVFIGLSGISSSANRDGAPGGSAIHLLRASGSGENGNLRLQSQFYNHGLAGRSGIRLTGIANPLDVAQRIKTTLHLPIAIEDRTKPSSSAATGDARGS